MQDKPVGGELI